MAMKNLSSAMILGVGVLLCFGGPVRAQFKDMGEAMKKGATDAGKEELMKKAGMPTAVPTAAATPVPTVGAPTPAGEAPGDTPAAAETPGDTGAVEVPEGEEAADTGAAEAPAGEAEVAPEPAAGEVEVAPPAGSVEEMIKKKAVEEGSKRMPSIP